MSSKSRATSARKSREPVQRPAQPVPVGPCPIKSLFDCQLHHILEQIFLLLDLKDLDRCKLVNREWNRFFRQHIWGRQSCWQQLYPRWKQEVDFNWKNSQPRLTEEFFMTPSQASNKNMDLAANSKEIFASLGDGRVLIWDRVTKAKRVLFPFSRRRTRPLDYPAPYLALAKDCLVVLYHHASVGYVFELQADQLDNKQNDLALSSKNADLQSSQDSQVDLPKQFSLKKKADLYTNKSDLHRNKAELHRKKVELHREQADLHTGQADKPIQTLNLRGMTLLKPFFMEGKLIIPSKEMVQVWKKDSESGLFGLKRQWNGLSQGNSSVTGDKDIVVQGSDNSKLVQVYNANSGLLVQTLSVQAKVSLLKLVHPYLWIAEVTTGSNTSLPYLRYVRLEPRAFVWKHQVESSAHPGLVHSIQSNSERLVVSTISDEKSLSLKGPVNICYTMYPHSTLTQQRVLIKQAGTYRRTRKPTFLLEPHALIIGNPESGAIEIHSFW